MESAVGFNSTGTLGAFQIGVLVSYVLFGVMNTQTYIYFGRFPNDSTKLKALVAFVWVCELADVLCVGNSLYIYTISNYAQPERISGAIPKSLDAAIPFSGIIIVCVQGFFAFRIYTLSKKLYIPIIICALSLVRLAVNTTIFITSLHMVSLSSYKERWEWLYTVGWSISAVDDLGITVILVIVLCRKRTHAFEERTVALVDKLILWTIETGLLSSASGIITMICFLTMKGNFIWLAFWIINTRVFSNSLLASLNSRATLRAMKNVSLPLSIPQSLQMTETGQIPSDAAVCREPCDKEPAAELG